jgi:hypothetical protein
MEEIVVKSTTLGVLTNQKKNSPFQAEQKFIGFIWKGVEKTLRLPREKIEKRMSQINEFLEGNKMVTYTEVKILVGRLNHVMFVLPQLKCYLCSLHKMLCGWVFREQPRPIPAEVIEDLQLWLTSTNQDSLEQEVLQRLAG